MDRSLKRLHKQNLALDTGHLGFMEREDMVAAVFGEHCNRELPRIDHMECVFELNKRAVHQFDVQASVRWKVCCAQALLLYFFNRAAKDRG